MSNIYTVPTDDDPEYDCEGYKTRIPKSMVLSRKQETQLIKLGCVYNPLQESKRSHFYKSPKLYDQQFALKTQQHQLKLQIEISQMLKQERQKQLKELDKMKALLSDSSKDDADDDKTFEEELTKQRKLVDDFIALDKKKSENASVAKAEKERKDQEEKASKEQQAKEQKQKIAQQLEDQKIARSSSVSPQGLEEYKKYYEKIELFKTTILPKLQDPAFRKKCFEEKLLIRKSVTQLTPDPECIRTKYTVVYNHLLKNKQQSADRYEYLLNQLSKFILAQVRQEVHANPRAVYFIAKFAYLMCSAIPEFLQYLMGRLMKRCPYLIPQYHDDDPSLSQLEIKTRLRYVFSSGDTPQPQSFLDHAERQKCYTMFYGALCQTIPDRGQPENPFPIKHAWVWLARICNMRPREITPFLVLGLLEVSAIRLLEAYPHQTPKVFRLIRETICPLYPISSGLDNKSSIFILEMLLDQYFSTGKPKCLLETA